MSFPDHVLATEQTRAEAREQREWEAHRSDEVLTAVLRSAFLYHGPYGPINRNTIDAITSGLINAGVDIDEFDRLLACGDPTKVEEE